MSNTPTPELNSLFFHGTFRSYQERILKKCENMLFDGKLHIVAAPGSGKTVLGLEIVRRLNRPTLILAPSITIREQWQERFFEYFVEEEDKEKWRKYWSASLEELRTVTCVTYQALYQYFRTEKAEILAKRLKQQGIETLCLDEAHHLKQEWWKALEQLTKSMPEIRLVALTATPPYDAGSLEWKRYSGLCGEIDAEIFIPELVQEGSLCPHQDFVYLCVPKREEKQRLKKIRAEAEQAIDEILIHPGLQAEIEAHPGVADPLSYAEMFLENPEYLTAILCYLNYKKIKAPGLRKLIGTRAVLPVMDEMQVSRLLHGILWEDSVSYSEKLREELSTLLKSRHLLRGNKMYFDRAKERDKILKDSIGKLQAMELIAETEREGLGSKLRLLILTDHIEKEQLSLVGNPEKVIGEIGTVPLFELMRRRFETDEQIRPAMLSGTLAILPNAAAAAGGLQGKPLTEQYVLISVEDGNRREITAKVTNLFTEGYFQILIGTVALLGEGWDCPSVNSVILASTAATYVQSNQMRGRALRIDREHPEKVSDIWHLASIEPQRFENDAVAGAGSEYENLCRRFQAFLGVEDQGTGVLNGIERLSLLQRPFTEKHIREINQKMLSSAQNKEQIRKQWEQAAYDNEDFSHIREETKIPRKSISKNYRYYNALAASVVGAVGLLLTLSDRFILPYLRHTAGDTLPIKLYAALVLICSTLLGNYSYKLVKKLTPQGRITQVAAGLWETLIERGSLSENTQVTVFEKSEYTVDVALENATVRESNLYAGCFQELYGMIENPRYLLKEKLLPGKYEYYNVPEILGRNKKDAESFCRHLKRHHQKFQLVYTRTPEGRKELLKARARGYGNICRQGVARQKRVKSKWE